MAVTVWTLTNQEIQICRQISEHTFLALRAGSRELSGHISWAGPVWPEPVLSVLRTRTFHLQTDQSGQAVRTNDKRPQSVYICHNWSVRIGQFLNTTHQFCRTERRFMPSCLYASRINGFSAHEQSSQLGNTDVDPANQFWKMVRALL